MAARIWKVCPRAGSFTRISTPSPPSATTNTNWRSSTKSCVKRDENASNWSWRTGSSGLNCTPRTVVTCFRHGLAYCPQCDKNVWLSGPGQMPGAYIGPAAKATAVYLRYQLNVPERKISQFFRDFFGRSFVPASA
jgi:hypothetical protein